MDLNSYNAMCEDAAFGDWLVETIADSIGIESKNIKGSELRRKIDRAIYKGTDCGAWVRFDEKGIIVGTIVEGRNEEYVERIQLPQDDDPQELCKRFWAAIENCENFAEEHFGVDDSEI